MMPNDGWLIPADWPVSEKLAQAVFAVLDFALGGSPEQVVDLAPVLCQEIERHVPIAIMPVELLAGYLYARCAGTVPVDDR